MKGVFILPSNIYKVEKDNRILYLNPDIPSWIVVDKNSAFLLELCKGENTIDEIIESYVEIAGEEKRCLVENFFNYAIKSKLFESTSINNNKILKCKQKLSLVQLSISSVCNLNCKYCYATDRKEKGSTLMTLNDFQRVIDEICSINPHTAFTLTGGEPLMNPLCFDIAKYINGKGCNVDILTNGTLINESNIENIKKYFWKVTISLDGSTKERHEMFRGPNTYDKTIHAISLLEQNKVQVHLSMTVNRLNIEDVSNMAKKYGKRLHFAPLFPAGNASKSETDLSISGIEYYNALYEADGVNPLGYCESTLDASLKCRRCKCAIGGTEVSISPTGDVYPCQLLHYPQFLMGNIKEASFIDLYNNSDIVELCSKMTVDNIEGCKDCPIKYICGGACRARAFHETGNIMVSGDFCEYEKTAFINGIFELYSHNAL